MQVDAHLGHSRYAGGVWGVGALLSSAALWVSALPWWLCVGMQMVLCAAAWWQWRTQWLVTALYHHKGRVWQCLVADQWQRVQVKRVHQIGVVWWAQMEELGAKHPTRHWVYIWRDQVDDETWRRLRVYATLHHPRGQWVG